jgi:hypothetical protein
MHTQKNESQEYQIFGGKFWRKIGVCVYTFLYVKKNPDIIRRRNCMSEHPFGTMKRGFNQGYFLLKGLVKVGGEMGLTMLAYNIRRVVNILGINKLMEIMNPG